MDQPPVLEHSSFWPYVSKRYPDCHQSTMPSLVEHTFDGAIWGNIAQVPDAFKHTTEGFGFYRSPNRQLHEQIRELGQTRAGYLVGSQFVYSQHMKAARFSGLTEEQVQAISEWSTADCFDNKQRVTLAYTDALILEYGRVSDDLFAKLKEHFSEVEIIELTYITCTYMMHGIMSRAFQLEYDEVDERVVEIAAPQGNTADVMGMVDKREQ